MPARRGHSTAVAIEGADVLTAVVTHHVAGQVRRTPRSERHRRRPADTGPSPIAPEVKELVWGAGSFIVFALLMRFFLFPKLKKGMDARYARSARGTRRPSASAPAHEPRSPTTSAQLAQVKAEAARRSRRHAPRSKPSGTPAWPRSTPASPSIAPRRPTSRRPARRRRTARRGRSRRRRRRAGELATGKAPVADAVERAVGEVVSVRGRPMSLLAIVATSPPGRRRGPIDSDVTSTQSPIFPESAEIIYGRSPR